MTEQDINTMQTESGMDFRVYINDPFTSVEDLVFDNTTQLALVQDVEVDIFEEGLLTFVAVNQENVNKVKNLADTKKRLTVLCAMSMDEGDRTTLFDGVVKFSKNIAFKVSVDDIVLELKLPFVELYRS